MFIHKNQLEHLLSPYHYYDKNHYDVEIEKVFMPAWQFVASYEDLPKHGDFLTMELFGKPLQIRNIDGEICAYLNVCSHRHALLTHEKKGNDPCFRCQYHGWQYSKSGQSRKIPDAGCFKPFQQEQARLKKFRTERLANLVYVNLSDSPISLQEYLGPIYEHHRCFGPPFKQIWKMEADYEANWKVIIENTLESYHIPFLHQKTFGGLPPEEMTEHKLHETYSILHTKEQLGWKSDVQSWFTRRLGMPATNIFTHSLKYPNLIYTGNDVHHIAQLVIPTSPTTTRHIVWVYGLVGKNHDPIRATLSWMMRKMVKYVAKKVISEDQDVFPDVQKGLQASPFRGAIGTREERIYVFQKYLLDTCKR